MKYKHSYQPRKSAIALAVAASISGAILPSTAISDTYVWGDMNSQDPALTTACASAPNAATVMFTMLDSAGTALENTSITTKGANKYQTATCGTLAYNTETQSGSAEIGAFEFFNGDAPAVAAGITIDKIPSGLDDGSGNLLLANMLFNWSVTNGIPVSLTWDAGPLLNEMDGSPTTFSIAEVTGIPTITLLASSPLDAGESTTEPASDGTYINASFGYLGLGPTPLATTEWNTTNVPACTVGSCLTINPSADIAADSTVEDTAVNTREFLQGDGVGVGGNPQQDGPFAGFNANFDFTSMKLMSFTDTTAPTLTMNAHVSPAGTTPLTLTIGTDTYSEPGATCTDAAPLGTTLTPVIAGDTVDDAVAATYTVTYNCGDGSGNAAATLTRTVEVVAAGTPVITMLGSTPVTHECATTYTDAGATALAGDEITNITTSIVRDAINTTVVVESAVGNYTVTYDVNDGTTDAVTVVRAVNVTDTIAPVVALLSYSNPDVIASSTTETPVSYSDPGASVADSCNTTLSSPMSATSGSVTITVPDTGADTLPYSLTYSVSDGNGNTGTATRNINVERSQPVISLVGGQVITRDIGQAYSELGMDIADVKDGDVIGVTADGVMNGITYTITGTVDTNTNGEYILTYNAVDSNGNNATTIYRVIKVGVFAVGSNFTMLDASGAVIGGTNDVVFDWDDTATLYTNVATDLTSNMSIQSAGPHPFFGAPWFAHHVRVFGEGTYTFETDNTLCESKTPSPDPINGGFKSSKITASADDIDVTGCPGTGTATTMTLTVGTNQVGVHMLFDYNSTYDIDVVNVYTLGAAWYDATGQGDAIGDLHTGVAGIAPEVTTTWKLVSGDANGDGINGAPMIDGPFVGFYANFNAGPTTYAGEQPAITTTTKDTKLGGAMSWAVLLGLLPLISLFRRRK